MTAEEIARDIYNTIVLSRRNDAYDQARSEEFIRLVAPLINDAFQAERLADARAVCPRCAGNNFPVELHDGKWKHILRYMGVIIDIAPCTAAAIWERGRSDIADEVDEEIARWSDAEFFGDKP